MPQGLFGQAREQLLVFRVRAGKTAFDVVEAQHVEDPRDALFVRGGKGHGRTLRAVAQSRVVYDDLPGGHKKTSRPSGWEVNRHQRRALRRGTSPANLDRDAALVAHPVVKARASARRRVWFRPPNLG